MRENASLARGLSAHAGHLTNAAVGAAVGMDSVTVQDVLGRIG